MEVKKVLVLIFICLFLFFYIYMPNVALPFNIIHLLTIFSFLILSLPSYRIIGYLRFNPLKRFIIFNTLAIVYVLILYVLLNGESLVAYSHFLIIFELIPISLFISLTLIKFRISKYHFYNLLLIVGVIQSLLVILTYFDPTIRFLLIEKYASKDFSELFEATSHYRLFGFARGLTFSMPLFQGVCIILSIVLTFYRSKKYLLFVPFYIISIALNARIGLISIFIVSSVLIIYLKSRQLSKQFIGLLAIFLIIFSTYRIIEVQAKRNPEIGTWIWLQSGLEEISLLQKGKSTGNIYALTETMWFTPEDTNDYIFGTGEIPYRRLTEKNSDIGYVQIFYFGGIMYSFLVYFSFILIIYSLMKRSPREEKVLLLSLLLYLCFANFKGNAFQASAHINGIVLILVFLSISLKNNISINYFARRL